MIFPPPPSLPAAKAFRFQCNEYPYVKPDPVATHGNVFADLGLPDADKLKIKSGLALEITRAIRRLGPTQEEAGRRMGLPSPRYVATSPACPSGS